MNGKNGSSDPFCIEKNAIKFEKKSALKLCAKYFPPKKQNTFVKNKLKRCFKIV